MVNSEAVRAILERVGGRWEPAILGALEAGPVRASQLRRAVSPGLDWRTYTDTLVRLQEKGLLTRLVAHDRQRPAVWYELTDAGRAVLELLTDVESWGAEHPEELAQLLSPAHDQARRRGTAAP